MVIKVKQLISCYKGSDFFAKRLIFFYFSGIYCSSGAGTPINKPFFSATCIPFIDSISTVSKFNLQNLRQYHNNSG